MNKPCISMADFGSRSSSSSTAAVAQRSITSPRPSTTEQLGTILCQRWWDDAGNWGKMRKETHEKNEVLFHLGQVDQVFFLDESWSLKNFPWREQGDHVSGHLPPKNMVMFLVLEERPDRLSSWAILEFRAESFLPRSARWTWTLTLSGPTGKVKFWGWYEAGMKSLLKFLALGMIVEWS